MLETIDLISGTVYHAAGGPPWDALPTVTLPQNLTWNDTGVAGARLVRTGPAGFPSIGGFKVIRGWKFEGAFTSASAGSSQFFLAGVSTGEQFGQPSIMRAATSSDSLSSGSNVIDDEFAAVSYPLSGIAPGALSDLEWTGFVLSMWGLAGSGTKDVTIPDGYLTTAELYVSDLPALDVIEQPSGAVNAGDTFDIRIRAYYTSDDERVVGAYFSLNSVDLDSYISIDSPGTQQTDVNGEIVWTCTALADAPSVDGSVFVTPLPFSADVLPAGYVPRQEMPLYSYQSSMFTTFPIDISIDGGSVVPEGCFWDGVVNAVEDCGTGGGGENVVEITGVFNNGYGYENSVWVGGEPGWCGATPDFFDGGWQLTRVFVDNSGGPLPECGELDLAGMPIVEISEPTYAEYNGGGIWFWNVGEALGVEGVASGDRVIIEVYHDSVGISYYWVTHFHVSA